MLKNVAIPLMLTASQAEGQVDTPGSADYWAKILKERATKGTSIKFILNGGEGLELPELSMPVEACTGTASTDASVTGVAAFKTADGDVATKTKAVADTQKLFDTAKKAIDDLKLPAGTWGAAEKTMKDAQAAVDLALKDTKVKAGYDAYLKAVKDADAASVKFGALLGKAKVLAANVTAKQTTLADYLKQDAMNAQAYAEIKAYAATASTRIATAVNGLYCQLGAGPMKKDGVTRAETTAATAAKTWDDLAGVKGKTKCTVGAIEYNTAPSITDVPGSKLRSATQRKSDGEGKLTAKTKYILDAASLDIWNSKTKLTTTAGNVDRDPVGYAAYKLGWKRTMDWLSMSRQREVAFWTSIDNKRKAALAIATAQQKAGYDGCKGDSTTEPFDYLGGLCTGSAKARMDQAVSEQKSNDGQPYYFPATRGAAGVIPTVEATITADFAVTNASKIFGAWTVAAADTAGNGIMDAWAGTGINNNTTANKNSLTYQWWALARDATYAWDCWWLKFGARTAKGANAANAGAGAGLTVGAASNGGLTMAASDVTSGPLLHHTEINATKYWKHDSAPFTGTTGLTQVDKKGAGVNTAQKCKDECDKLNWPSLLEKPLAGTKTAYIMSNNAHPSGMPNFTKAAATGVKACLGYSYDSADVTKFCSIFELDLTKTGAGEAMTKLKAFLQTTTKNAADKAGKQYLMTNVIPVLNGAMEVAAIPSSKKTNTTGFTDAEWSLSELSIICQVKYAAALAKLQTDWLDPIKELSLLDAAYIKAYYENLTWSSLAAKLAAGQETGYFPAGVNKTGGAKPRTIAEELAKINSDQDDSIAVVGAGKTQLKNASDAAAAAKLDYETALKVITAAHTEIDTAQRDATWLGFKILAAEEVGDPKTKIEAEEKAIKKTMDDYRLVGTGLGTPGDVLAEHTKWKAAMDAVTTKLADYNTARAAYKIPGGAKTGVATLDTALTKATTAYNTENDKIKVGSKLELEQAKQKLALAKAKSDLKLSVTACRTAAFDAYRGTLNKALEQRGKDLKTIKDLIAAQKTPAAGAAGSRCEKALSNGTFRPTRALDQTKEGQVCDKGLCCGAAKVPLTAGTTEKAGFRIIESCINPADPKYKYQPPRAPLALTMPTKIEADFTCIQGAKQLAAAATAAATALYMLA